MFIKFIIKSLIIFAFIFGLFSFVATAQEKDTIPIQLSGLVVTADSLKPIPFASVSVHGTDRGAWTDVNGFYSLIIYRNESVEFSSIGFKPAYYHVPDTLTKYRYTLIQSLRSDTIYLAETYIFPWQTYEQFKIDFVKVEVPDELAYSNALKNIEQIKKSLFTVYLPMDGAGNYKCISNSWAKKASSIGFMPTIGIGVP
jgi:hypothetical protein